MDKTKDPIIVFFTFVVLLSIITKFYSGPGQIGVSYYLNSIFVVLTWCLLIALMLPDMKNKSVALIAFAMMCCLEMFQIFIPEQFNNIREALLYPQLLDAHGSWNKIPFYGIAAFLGTRLLRNYKKQH